MSRKREKQRENRRELERQLGAAGAVGDVDADDLRARGRVSEGEVEPALVLRAVKRGLLSRAAPSWLAIALYVVDAGGVRLGRVSSWRGAPTKTGAVALTRLAAQGEDKIRYARPGTFVVAAVLLEGAATEAEARAAAALAEPAARFVVDGAALGLDDIARGPRFEEARAASLPATDAPLAAACVLAVPAVHRVQKSVDAPLVSERVDAVLSLKLRL